MKFRSICAVLTAVIGLTTGSSSAEVALGVKGGLNLSRLYGSDVEGAYDNMSMRPGLAIGAALQLKLANAFAIQPEVLFSCKGFKEEIPSIEIMGMEMGGFDQTFSIKYLEIPVLFQILIPAGETVVPQIFVGPSVAFKVGVSGKMDDEDLTDDEIEMINENMKSVDFGLTMGAGLGIKAGPGKLTLDARFTLGFVELQDLSDEAEEFLEDSWMAGTNKNMALSILAGYMFEF